MIRVLSFVAQAAIYGVFAAALIYGSSRATYERVPPDAALIKLSFAHGANRIGECHKRTREELSELAPNMRAALDCPRQRLDIVIEMKIDNKVMYHDVLTPTGLHGDGVAITYQRFIVPSGRHALELSLKDSARTDGYDYVSSRIVDLSPGQSLAIDFQPGDGGFSYE